MMISKTNRTLAVLASFFLLQTTRVAADVEFSAPSAGQVVSGNTFRVEFTDGTGKPALSDFTSYTLQLCAGGNSEDDFDILHTFTDSGDFSKSSYDAVLEDLKLGAATKNAYFLRTIGVAPGGTVINYSDRFTLSGMTGTFSSKAEAGLKDLSSDAGPATANNIVSHNEIRQAADGFDTPFSQQSGLVRFAPMAPMPGSKITAKGKPTPLFPVSDVPLWNSHSNFPLPDATQTVTQPQTFSVQMMEATIPPQRNPQYDQARFLERWKD